MTVEPSENTKALPANSIGKQAAWNYLTFGLSKASTVIMTVVVARLLTPSDFGQFTLVLVVVNVFEYVKDLGVSAALVQSPRSWDRLAPTGLTLSVIFGAAVGGIVAVVAPAASSALHHPQLTPLIRVLGLGMALAAFSAIPAARLRRDLDFRRRMWPEFISSAAKAIITIALAFAGLGVWSLVYGQLAGTLVLASMYWWVSATPVRFGFDRQQARDLLRYGIPHTAATLLAFAIYNVDYLAIGVRLGDRPLGLYTIAYRLPELLVLSLCVVISEVLFSSLSRLQHSRTQLRQHYLQVVTVVAALSAPISITLAASAPSVIQTLYGHEYAPAAPVLAVLSAYALIYSASWHAGDVFKAVGKPSLLVATSMGKLAIMIGPIWWAAGRSIVFVGLVLAAVELVHLVANMALVRSSAGIAVRSLGKALLQPMPAAICLGVVTMAIGHMTARWPAPLTLITDVLAGLPIYLAALRLTAPGTFATGLTVLRSVRHRPEAP